MSVDSCNVLMTYDPKYKPVIDWFVKSRRLARPVYTGGIHEPWVQFIGTPRTLLHTLAVLVCILEDDPQTRDDILSLVSDPNYHE